MCGVCECECVYYYYYHDLELSAIAAGEVCSNPESLKFQYDVESDHDPPTTTGTTTAPKSFVYREQV